MKVITTPIAGVFIVEPERVEDERGFFARTWCQREFADHGLSPDLAQCSISFNRLKGTLRGMHYQAAPYEEAKLVRATKGKIYDVALDLRQASPTYLKWHAVELSEEDRRAIYIPEGCAHGFQTITENTEVLYQVSSSYREEASRGVRWNDPAFGILWPEDVLTISARDRDYPDYE